MKKIRQGIHSLKCFWHYNRRTVNLPYPPRYLQVELTSYCNLRCPFCFQSVRAIRRKNGYIEIDLYKKIIDEVKNYIFRISLHHRGEPLLHPELSRCISLAKGAGIKTNIHTNATLLTPQKSKEILESGLDELHFSFDGEDPQTFERMRKGAKYKETLENIVNFLKLKKKYGLARPTIEIQVLRFYPDEKRGLSKEFKAHFENLPVDYFTTGVIINWAGDFRDEAGLKINAPRGRYAPCKSIWSDLIICWDGEVVPCCKDYDSYYPLGNVKDQPLLKIWNNERMQELRRKLIEKKYQEIDLCRNCDALWMLEYEASFSKKAFAKLISLGASHHA